MDVIGRLPDRFRLIGLAACSQWQRLAQQANRFRPAAVAVYDAQAAEQLSKALNGASPRGLPWALKTAI